jgi:hypothetical protein
MEARKCLRCGPARHVCGLRRPDPVRARARRPSRVGLSFPPRRPPSFPSNAVSFGMRSFWRRDLDAEGLVLIALSALDLPTLYLRAEDIRREPLLSNSRRVWSYRMHPVGITMRTKVLSRLRKAGPMALSALITAICSDRDHGDGLREPRRTRPVERSSRTGHDD